MVRRRLARADPVTFLEWLQVAQTAVMLTATFIAVTLRTGFKGGRWTADQGGRMAALEARTTGLEGRLDHGQTNISDLTDAVQTMPERLRKDFLSRDLADERHTSHEQRISRLESRRVWNAES